MSSNRSPHSLRAGGDISPAPSVVCRKELETFPIPRLYSMISSERRWTFYHTCRWALDVYARITGDEPTAASSFVWAHDARHGAVEGTALAMERRRKELAASRVPGFGATMGEDGVGDEEIFSGESQAAMDVDDDEPQAAVDADGEESQADDIGDDEEIAEALRNFPPESCQVVDFFHTCENVAAQLPKQLEISVLSQKADAPVAPGGKKSAGQSPNPKQDNGGVPETAPVSGSVGGDSSALGPDSEHDVNPAQPDPGASSALTPGAAVLSKNGKIAAKQVAKICADWTGRLLEWLWFIRLSFNRNTIRAFLEEKYDLLASEQQWRLMWYIHCWKITIGYSGDEQRKKALGAGKKKICELEMVPELSDDFSFPLFCSSPLARRPATSSSSAGVETHQRLFLNRFRVVSKRTSHPPKKSGIVRFLKQTFSKVLKGMRIRTRKMAGIGRTLVKLKPISREDEVVCYKLSKPRKVVVYKLGQPVELDVPSKWWLMPFLAPEITPEEMKGLREEMDDAWLCPSSDSDRSISQAASSIFGGSDPGGFDGVNEDDSGADGENEDDGPESAFSASQIGVEKSPDAPTTKEEQAAPRLGEQDCNGKYDREFLDGEDQGDFFGIGADEDEAGGDPSRKLEGEELWEVVEKLLFGSYEEVRPVIHLRKCLKRIAVVGFWEELFTVWGCPKPENDGPCCLHCARWGLHAWCTHVNRVLAARNPTKHQRLWAHAKKGRPKKKVKAKREQVQRSVLAGGFGGVQNMRAA